MQFLFEEPVTGFTAGQFGAAGSNVPCMAYAAAGKVVLFHNVRLPVMVTETLTDMMAREQPWPGDGTLSAAQRQALYRWCLYGFPCGQPGTAEGEQDRGRSGGGEERGVERAESGHGAEAAECDPVPRFQPSDAV